MNIDFQSRNAQEQITAREIIHRCIPLNIFTHAFVNTYNKGREYVICYKKGGYRTYGLDMDNKCLRVTNRAIDEFYNDRAGRPGLFSTR